MSQAAGGQRSGIGFHDMRVPAGAEKSGTVNALYHGPPRRVIPWIFQYRQVSHPPPIDY